MIYTVEIYVNRFFRSPIFLQIIEILLTNYIFYILSEEKLQNIRGVAAKLYGYPRVGRNDKNNMHWLPLWKQFNLLVPYDGYNSETENELQRQIQYIGNF